MSVGWAGYLFFAWLGFCAGYAIGVTRDRPNEHKGIAVIEDDWEDG